jgi:hypothetical protein
MEPRRPDPFRIPMLQFAQGPLLNALGASPGQAAMTQGRGGDCIPISTERGTSRKLTAHIQVTEPLQRAAEL